jgi:hypothetical protein
LHQLLPPLKAGHPAPSSPTPFPCSCNSPAKRTGTPSSRIW